MPSGPLCTNAFSMDFKVYPGEPEVRSEDAEGTAWRTRLTR